MKLIRTLGFTIAVAGLLAACSTSGSKKGPIEQEMSRISADGKKMTSDGEKLIKEGHALQNSARESRVVAASQRRQVNALLAQGKTEEADQLKLRADQADADAAESDNKGRVLEAQGLALIGSGQDSMNRSNSLEKQGEHIGSR